MSYEYKIEHYGAFEPDLGKITTLVGEELMGTLDFLLSVESASTVVVAISGSDVSRIAFSKTIEYLLTISDSVVVHDL